MGVDEPLSGVTPSVAADLASDKKGEPRSSEPSPPPPGTVVPGFWQRKSTHMAVVGTVVVANLIWRPLVTQHLGAEVAAAIEAAEWLWLAAIGISRSGDPELRWK